MITKEMKTPALYRRSKNYKTTFCTSCHDDGNEFVDTGDGLSERLKFLECKFREMFAIEKSAKGECTGRLIRKQLNLIGNEIVKCFENVREWIIDWDRLRCVSDKWSRCDK